MNYSHIIINRLLDKYEKSNHAEGKNSNRRVLIKTDKVGLPEYDYHNDNIRDAFNNAVIELECKNLVLKKWVRKGYLLSEIWLNLGNLDSAYSYVERKTQKTLCDEYILMFLSLAENCSTTWIRGFAISQIENMKMTSRPTQLCKRDYIEIESLIIALKYCDFLQGESITMRSFSINCYRDSKYFEKNVKDLFLSIAKKYNTDFMEADEEKELGWREQLMILGIYARPELYELSGDIVINFQKGSIDLGIIGPPGIALPDTLEHDILSVDMKKIHKVIFIENKTCYDEYIIRYKQRDELVFYQGGFISKKKAKFIMSLNKYAITNTVFYFWGDIDIGGFTIFNQLKKYIPDILPWKMDSDNVLAYHAVGLKRSDAYFTKLNALLHDSDFSVFHAAINQLLSYNITIEQECMLESFNANI